MVVQGAGVGLCLMVVQGAGVGLCPMVVQGAGVGLCPHGSARSWGGSVSSW